MKTFRMGPKHLYIAFYTIVRREWMRTFRIWAGTILPPVITTILYFVIFGNVIGKRIGQMDGFSYLQFIAPGLIMMAVISNAYSSTVAAFFSTKFHRDIEDILVTPMPSWILVLGFMVSGMIRGILIGIIVTIIALFFTHLSVHSFPTIILVVLLSSAIFSLGGILNAIFADSFDEISIIPTFVLTPLTYLGGVFYSLNLLPPFWRHLSLINPIVYIIQSFRYGILGIESHNILLAFGVMFGIVVVCFCFTLWLVKRGVGIK